MPFFALNSSFYHSLALLCNSKKSSLDQKNLIFRFNPKSRDDFGLSKYRNKENLKTIYFVFLKKTTIIFEKPL